MNKFERIVNFEEVSIENQKRINGGYMKFTSTEKRTACETQAGGGDSVPDFDSTNSDDI